MQEYGDLGCPQTERARSTPLRGRAMQEGGLLPRDPYAYGHRTCGRAMQEGGLLPHAHLSHPHLDSERALPPTYDDPPRRRYVPIIASHRDTDMLLAR